jgi:hypothetical protein
VFNNWAEPIIAALLFATLVLTMAFVVVLKSCKHKRGRNFVTANQILIAAIVLCSFSGYSFFAILIARIVHDLCAFQTYWVHDTNRLTAGKRLTLHLPDSLSILRPFATLLAKVSQSSGKGRTNITTGMRERWVQGRGVLKNGVKRPTIICPLDRPHPPTCNYLYKLIFLAERKTASLRLPVTKPRLKMVGTPQQRILRWQSNICS